MRTSDNANTMQAIARADYDILSTMGEIRRILSSPANCRANFAGLNAMKLDNFASELNRAGATAAEKKANPYQVDKKHGLSRVEIVAMNLRDQPNDDVQPVRGGTGTTNFVVQFKKIINHSRTINQEKTIRLIVETNNTGQITNCQSATSGEENIWNRNPTDLNKISYNGGNVGIGVADPQAALDVNGQIKIGPGNTTSCDATREGSIRYHDKAMTYCNGTNWVSPSTGAAKHSECKWAKNPWDGWVNDYDKQFHFQCPEGKFIVGLLSRHNSKKEDRKFNFLCCKLGG